ncbi:hypothetical protein COF68_04995 [Bacillus toyonensis]|uniref:hypothetical protein n=1 Tax=Bacillus toyonensis TaxID=155322 RepID=UPI000BFD0925|nr:hypothetical protein [Bacillus toyonensis]PHE64205.1 hypothetical protein COF68_04995 [Bacillus toyonensis]
MTQVNIEEILKQADAINKQVAKHNSDNQKSEGMREATRTRIISQLNEFNSMYGTSLTVDNTELFQETYKNAVISIHNETQQLSQVLEAVRNNDVKLVTQLTGIDIAQDTIKMPRIDINLDEMEKHADKSLKIAQDNATIEGALVGEETEVETPQEEEVVDTNAVKDFFANVNKQAQETKIADNIQAGVSGAIQTPTEPAQPVQQTQQETPLFQFGGNVTPEPEQQKQESQPAQQTQQPIQFTGFNVPSQPTQPVQEEKPKATVPDFSRMFGGSQPQEEEKVEEKPADVPSFIGNFKQEGQPSTPKPIESNSKLEDALANQGQNMPEMNFGSIDIEDEQE